MSNPYTHFSKTTHHIPAYPDYKSKDEFIKRILIHFFTDNKCLSNCTEKIVIDFEVKEITCPLLSRGFCLAMGINKRAAAADKYKELYGEENLFEVLL